MALLDGFSGDDYIVQYDVNLNGGADAIALVRYQDPDNHYRVRLTSSGISLRLKSHGAERLLAKTTHTASGTISMKINLVGELISVWVAGTEKLNDISTSAIGDGGFALAGEKPKFENIVIGFDTNADDVIDDTYFTDTFSDTSVALNADHSDGAPDDWDKNGNMLNDGTFTFAYDAWNRMVSVKSEDGLETVATYEYDALGRRINKSVAGTVGLGEGLNGTTYYYYNKQWQMLESRDGSENVDTRVIYGTRYVDEIVLFEKLRYGSMFVFQDANWNVTSTVNYDAVVLDRIHNTPYGEPTFDSYTINGDYDGDGDLDSTDDSNLTTCKNGSQPVTGACRVFDFDNDGDVDIADESRFDELYSGSGTDITRQPGRSTSANGFIFAHQGLMIDEETALYYNRFRLYNSQIRRFLTRDPFEETPHGRLNHILDHGGAASLSAIAQYIDTALQMPGINSLSLYEYESIAPLHVTDALGLAACAPDCAEQTLCTLMMIYNDCAPCGTSEQQCHNCCNSSGGACICLSCEGHSVPCETIPGQTGPLAGCREWIEVMPGNRRTNPSRIVTSSENSP